MNHSTALSVAVMSLARLAQSNAAGDELRSDLVDCAAILAELRAWLQTPRGRRFLAGQAEVSEPK